MANLVSLERDMTWIGLSTPLTPASAQSVQADSCTIAVDGTIYPKHAGAYGTPVSATPAQQGRAIGCLLTPIEGDNMPFRVKGFQMSDTGGLFGVGFARGNITNLALLSDLRWFKFGYLCDDVVVVRMPTSESPNYGKPIGFACLGFNSDPNQQLLQGITVQRLSAKPDQYAMAVS